MIGDPFLFLLSLGLLGFVPGYLFLEAVFPRRSTFNALEKLVFSFVASIGFLDLGMLALDRFGLPLTRTSVLGMILALSVIFLAIILWRGRSKTEGEAGERLGLTGRESALLMLLLVLTIVTRVFFLSFTVAPTSTDLGHHMYWAKLIAEENAIPQYAERELHAREDGSLFLTEPQPIADFIIGEHLPFAALSLVSGIGFLSAFPALFLFLINLVSILALALLARRLVSDLRERVEWGAWFTGNHAFLIALLVFGPLYALSSPQSRYVSGGVVGNIFGNLLIPVTLYLFYRAFREKNARLFAFGCLTLFVLAYTHHLSTLILLFSLAGIVLGYLLFNFSRVTDVLVEWWQLVTRPASLATLGGLLLFFLFVAMPTYLEREAIDTAIGTPTRTTRTGLSFLQISSSSGEARLALGLAAVAVLGLAAGARRSYAGALLLGWLVMILVMTLRPHWLFIDIPSNRIGTYLSFPVGVAGAVFLTAFIAWLRDRRRETYAAPGMLLAALLLFSFSFLVQNGSNDNNQSLPSTHQGTGAVQTFAASEYLRDYVASEEMILKDHNYLAADAWIKLFFMRDYNYPLSRALFGRYQTNPDREQCTLLMIATPNTPEGEDCFRDTGTRYIMVHPFYDATQFEKSRDFARVFASPQVHIYKRLTP